MKHYASFPILALDVHKVTEKRVYEQMSLDEFRSLLMENKILDAGELVILSE